jgi:hypothetical protein
VAASDNSSLGTLADSASRHYTHALFFYSVDTITLGAMS